MIKMIIACDVCGQELPVEGDILLTHRTKEVNTKDIYPHLCKNCADKIDNAIRLGRAQGAKRAELMAKYQKMNAERKKKLGLEG
jgi:uncharacterized protein YlaI